MKNIIIVFSLLLFQSCKPQSKDELKKTVNERVKINIDTIKESVKINIDTIKLPNVDSKNSMEIGENMVIKYKENLNISKEDLEKLPVQIREKFIILLNSPIYYELQINANKSIYRMITKNKIESATKAQNVEQNTENKTIVQLPEQNVYKNFADLTYTKQEHLINKKYLIKEKLSKINWELSNEIKKIDKYNCKKAKAIIKNKQVIAWYCEDIAISDGPSIYYGLPGLILQIEAEDRLYSAIEIRFEKELILSKNTDGKVISQKDYDVLLKNEIDNPIMTNETKE